MMPFGNTLSHRIDIYQKMVLIFINVGTIDIYQCGFTPPKLDGPNEKLIQSTTECAPVISSRQTHEGAT
jgi:hypothetical protein